MSSPEFKDNQPASDVQRRMPRKKGPIDDVSDDWRRLVIGELAKRGMTRDALATGIEVHKSAITVLLRMSTDTPPGPSTSALVRPVAQFLGLPTSWRVDDLSEAEHILRIAKAAKVKQPEKYVWLMKLLEEAAEYDPKK